MKSLIVITTLLGIFTIPIYSNYACVERERLPESRDSFIARITAYTASTDECDDSPYITSDGTDLRTTDENIVACPRRYEFGSKWEIDGVVYTCHDRLNIKYDNTFDILVPTKQEAFKMGVRYLEVVKL